MACFYAIAGPAHGLECSWSSGLPCSFGPCEYSKSAEGLLQRAGKCSGAPNSVLSLSNKGISAISPDVFDGMPNLKVLRLDYNQLSTLPPGVFDMTGNLESLFLQYNRMSRLPTDIFDKLTSLEELDLSSNRFFFLPDIFHTLGRLRHLSLSQNPSLQCLPMSAEQHESLETYSFEPRGTEKLCQICGDSEDGKNPSGCKCSPGHTGPDGGPCLPCTLGKYKPSRGDAPCLQCPGNSTSSGDRTECRCKNGFVEHVGAEGGCKPRPLSFTVKLVLELAMSLEAFNEKRGQFMQALAAAAGVSVEHVSIDSITRGTGRRLLQTGDSIQVAASITVADEQAGQALTLPAINKELRSAGLPEGTFASSKAKTDGSNAAAARPLSDEVVEEESWTQGTAFVAALGGIGGVCVCVCFAAVTAGCKAEADAHNEAHEPPGRPSNAAMYSARQPRSRQATPSKQMPSAAAANHSPTFRPAARVGGPDLMPVPSAHTRPSLQEPSPTMRYPSQAIAANPGSSRLSKEDLEFLRFHVPEDAPSAAQPTVAFDMSHTFSKV